VIPLLLSDFYQYNDFLDLVDQLIDEHNWSGIFQVASFHPDYCFAGVPKHSPENLTNRAPYPIFHIIREESMAKAIDHYPDTETIPERNIELMNTLSDEQIKLLFPHLS
jgi:hypothetical protein